MIVRGNMSDRATKIFLALAIIVLIGYVAYAAPASIKNNAVECAMTAITCGLVLLKERYSSWRQKRREHREYERTAQSISYEKD